MQPCENTVEDLFPNEAQVFPTDTLLCALRVMKEHHVALVPVMDGEGHLVGILSDQHVRVAWAQGPLTPVARVMTAHHPVETEPLELVAI